MNTYTINILDTITNLILLLAIILPVYGLILYHIIGDMPIIRSPMFKVSINGKLRIITIRNPWSGKWITTITTSMPATHIDLTPKPVRTPVAMFANPYRFAMGTLIIWLLAACGPISTTAPSNSQGDKISTQYVADGYSNKKSCWWPTATGDSLKVEGSRYTISNRSRYRLATLERAVIDSLLKGDVWVNDWTYYRDTKRDDTVYVFNRCDVINLGGD